MDALRPVRTFGVGPTTMLLAVVAAVVLVVLAPGAALAAVGAVGGPSISADPDHGAAASSTTVSGSSLGTCSGPFLVLWDGAEVARTRLTNGGFSTRVTVPDGAKAEEHWISVRCAGNSGVVESVTPSIPFVVEADYPATQTQPQTQPQLAVTPTSGQAGQRVRATGSGFAGCAGADAVLWFDSRGSGGSATVPVAASGGFTADLVVPAALSAGGHTLYAACARRAEVNASADVTVLAGGAPATGATDPADSPVAPSSPVPSSSSGSPADPLLSITGGGTSGGAGLTGPQWGVLLGGALAAAGAGAYGLTRRRGPGWVGQHVTAHPRPPEPGSYLVADADDPGGRSHSVRLEPRPDPGDQHIEETER